MNSVIKKLPLPCDMQYEIYNFCYNEYGFTKEQIETINYYKENKKGHNLRVFAELKYWKTLGTAVSWLKGYGGYPNFNFELHRLKEMVLSNAISINHYIVILESIKKNLPINMKYESMKYYVPDISPFHCNNLQLTLFCTYTNVKIDKYIDFIKSISSISSDHDNTLTIVF